MVTTVASSSQIFRPLTIADEGARFKGMTRLLFALVWVIPGLLATVQLTIFGDAAGTHYGLMHALVWQGSAWLTWGVWSQVILTLVDRVKLGTGRIAGWVAIHVLATLVICAANLLMIAWLDYRFVHALEGQRFGYALRSVFVNHLDFQVVLYWAVLGAAYMVEVVKSVATPDDLTAVVTLKEPNSAFLSYLASPFGPKMESPTGLKSNAGSDNAQTYLTSHDLGTGPYQLTTAQTGIKYALTRYDKYWGTKSPFTTVNLPVYTDESALELAFDKGTVDLIAAALPSSSLDKYSKAANAANYFLPTLQGALVTVNSSHEFFKTAAARVAFLKSIDQSALVSKVLGKRSEPATTMYAKGMVAGGGDKQAITFEKSALKTYVAALPGNANKKLVIGYANGNVNAQSMANIVTANLQTDGLTPTAQGYDTSTVFGWINDPPTGPDAFIDGNNGPDGGDPYMWGHVFWDAKGGINYFGCQSDEVNGLLTQAVKTGDTAAYVKAGDLYGKTGCFFNLSYNKDWVLAQKWLTGVAESQNLGANELDFSKLGGAK